jgi:Na+/H+ antiporter
LPTHAIGRDGDCTIECIKGAYRSRWLFNYLRPEVHVGIVAVVLGLIVFAVVVATLARRIRTPAPSLLVIAGLILGLHPTTSLAIPPNVIGFVVLPPLVYAAAIDVSVRELRAVLGSVVALAVGLVVFSAFVIALVLHAVSPRVPVAAAFVLGAILASTDPVAVSALARKLRLPPKVLALVQGESLFNDATSLVMFKVAIGIVVAGGAINTLAVAREVIWLGGGGAMIGWLIAILVEQLRRRTADAALETVIALLTPYVVYVLAESIHSSGITAVVICGLALSRRGTILTGGHVRLQIDHVFAVVVFLLESVVFAIIGLEIPTLVRDLHEGVWSFALPALLVTLAMVLTRTAWVFPTGLLQPARRQKGSRPWAELAVVSWAGTRGVVPLAAALAIPLTTASGEPFPQRSLLQVLAITCIAITLVVQGLTLAPVTRRLGVRQDPSALREQRAMAMHALAAATLAQFEKFEDESGDSTGATALLHADLKQRELETRKHLAMVVGSEEQSSITPPARNSARRIRLELLAVETEELNRLREEGIVGENVRRELQRSIDLDLNDSDNL